MAKLFEKYETIFCIFLIVVYLLVNSVCVQSFGETSWIGCVANTLLSVGLIVILLVLKRTAEYGLRKAEKAEKCLYFIPLLILVTVNLWGGIDRSHSIDEILCHILTMINIGFMEEIIFRGFLFKMMAKTNVKSAMIVSALTFGAGHIINLLNGAQLIPTLLQIIYATATGYLFVVLFHKSKSLVPCIVTHALVNALSIFQVENTATQLIAPVCLTVIPVAYALYIHKQLPEVG